jgi:23S rRNA (pseudouridine1915-N3)-methyltransferase
MIITVLSPGKTKKEYLRQAIDDFIGRLSHLVRLDYKEIKVKGQSAKQPDLQKEGAALQAHIPESAYLICLDIKGRIFSSEAFAGLIQNQENQSRQHICFLIGGPLGLGQTLLDQADLRLSFSPMTFTHDMARFLLLEQLYRAYSIKNGTGYHK